MANARLKLARDKSRKRRRNETESIEKNLAETPVETIVAPIVSVAQNDTKMKPNDPILDHKQVLLDRKHMLELRINDLTLGKSLSKVEEPGYDVNGHRLERVHRDFLFQEMVCIIFFCTFVLICILFLL